MIAPMDGNASPDKAASGKSAAACPYCVPGFRAGQARATALALVALTLGTSLATARAGSSLSGPVLLDTTCRVMANRALALADGPSDPAEREQRVVRANQPTALPPVKDAAANKDETTPPDTVVEPAPLPPKAASNVPPPDSNTDQLLDNPVLLASAQQSQGGAPAGAAATGDSDLIAGIDVQSHRARPVVVSRNSSAVVDLKARCDRAEIADPNIAEIFVVSPSRIIVTGRNFGSTQMILWFGDQQRVFSINVEHDLSVLNEAIRRVSPTARVEPRSVNGVIVLAGTVPDAQSAERIVEIATLYQGGVVRNQLSVAGVQQTMLRVVVAEVNKEAVRQLGFNWAIGASDWSRDFFFANNVAQLNPTVYSSNGLANILAPNPAGQLTYSVAATANGANTNLTFGFPRAEFQVFMQALRQNSLARVLAEPNLVAISGQTATFLAGGEVPIPVTQGGAVAGSITIEYKEFGVRLAFTPTVLAGQIVRLHVMSEVSDAIPGMALPGGLPVFSFTTRRVESTIECGNGQTFAMAGLLSERVQAVSEKIPGLGDLPVLGSLFSSMQYQRNNTELVILVTPQLVEPLDPQQVPPPPGSEMGHPDDFQFFALGQLEGTPRTAPSVERVPREEAPVTSPPSVSSASWPSSPLTLRGSWGYADFE